MAAAAQHSSKDSAVDLSTEANDNVVSRQHDPLTRLRMSLNDRLMTMAVVSFGAGALCGGYVGGKHSSRQYLAERAHRLPTTAEGWYFYQKWKNYRTTLGAIKGAARYGAKISACVMAFSAIEAMADRVVGEAQMASSAIAGLSTAIGVSLVARLPRSSARRARAAGLCVGLLTGCLQDANRWAHGHPPAYVGWLQKKAQDL
ncbi:hypothetical protein IWW48_003754 [Coemansia sp. RSA 1200]|nr:hypothetical protein IWW48_003754 [Coemansia sp. RSA 1200]